MVNKKCLVSETGNHFENGLNCCGVREVDDDDDDKIIKIIISLNIIKKYPSNLPGHHESKELQKTAILCAAHELRKVLI
jgi:hypothetical protein